MDVGFLHHLACVAEEVRGQLGVAGEPVVLRAGQVTELVGPGELDAAVGREAGAQEGAPQDLVEEVDAHGQAVVATEEGHPVREGRPGVPGRLSAPPLLPVDLQGRSSIRRMCWPK